MFTLVWTDPVAWAGGGGERPAAWGGGVKNTVSQSQ